MMRPIFQAWLDPFKDYGANTVTIRNTGGTDHQSFDAVGLPGFQFIQDPMDYSTETHHSTADMYDHLQAGDLMEASAIMAAVVYDAATREEMLPRKPLPKPQPPRRRREKRTAGDCRRQQLNCRGADLQVCGGYPDPPVDHRVL